MKKLLFALLAITTLHSTAQCPWTTQITNCCHIVAVPQQLFSTVCGVALEDGDVIGGFYDSSGTLACGGFIYLTGVTTALPLWGDNPYTPGKDGFDVGEYINWKVYHNGMEYVFEFGYMDPSVDPSITSTAWWTLNGASALDNTLAVTEAKADFTWDFFGTTVSFNNHSEGYSDVLWDFGDGYTSTLVNPTHTFTNGVFPVTLQCFDDCDGDIIQYTLQVLSIHEIKPVIKNEIFFDILGRENKTHTGLFIVNGVLVLKAPLDIPK